MRNMSIYFDSFLAVDRQVNAASKVCYYQICNTSSTIQYIRTVACETLACDLVTSLLDYGNVTLYGLPSRLNVGRVQNFTAWLVT